MGINKLLLCLLPIVLVSFLAYKYFLNTTPLTDGKFAPDFEAELIDGSQFKLSDTRGKYVLLDFWGSWCGPCRKMNPKLKALHEKYSDKLTVITVALEKEGTQWKAAAKKDGFVWKHQIVTFNRFIFLSEIAQLYGVTEIPAKFIISPEGILLPKMTFDEIDKLLSKQK